jgi:hypothetical protein
MNNLPNESMFMSIYKTNHLSPTFDVIYQEAVRGNHILFRPSDVSNWSSLGKKLPSTDILDEVSEVFSELFRKASFREMCDSIDRLSESARYWLFRLYMNFIESLKIEVRASFN